MKAVLVLITFLYVQAVSAGGFTPLDKKDLSLSQAKGKISNVQEMCPHIPGRMSCMAYGSTVTVKVTLGGCLDRLGGHFSKFEVIDGHGVLYFGAINIANTASRTARCVAAPFEIVKIGVPYEGEIELVNIDYIGTAKPQN
jgi:hypothetical protein